MNRGSLAALALDHRRLYRLPWSLTDNVIAWLEPTKQCNATVYEKTLPSVPEIVA